MMLTRKEQLDYFSLFVVALARTTRMTTLECSFTCDWFHSYRSECLATPCLSVGNGCVVAGAASGTSCADWCCVREPVRGLIFLIPALAGLFLLVVVARCAFVMYHRRQKNLRVKALRGSDESSSSEVEEPTYLEDDSRLHIQPPSQDRQLSTPRGATPQAFKAPPSVYSQHRSALSASRGRNTPSSARDPFHNSTNATVESHQSSTNETRRKQLAAREPFHQSNTNGSQKPSSAAATVRTQPSHIRGVAPTTRPVQHPLDRQIGKSDESPNQFQFLDDDDDEHYEAYSPSPIPRQQQRDAGSALASPPAVAGHWWEE